MCRDLNTPILEQLVKLRAQKAQLLGFKTHSDFILDARMAKTMGTGNYCSNGTSLLEIAQMKQHSHFGGWTPPPLSLYYFFFSEGVFEWHG